MSEINHKLFDALNDYGGLHSLHQGYCTLSHLLANDYDDLSSKESIAFLLDLLNKAFEKQLTQLRDIDIH